MLSICFFGKDRASDLRDNVSNAAELSDEVFFVALGDDDESKAKASDMGTHIVDIKDLSSALQTEWILFLKPNESPFLTSMDAFYLMLGNRECQGYLVYARSCDDMNLLENHQLIRNLDQYKRIDNCGYVTTAEPRLVRKAYAAQWIKNFVKDELESQLEFCREIVDGLSIKSISENKTKHSADSEASKEHDKRCLKGEIYYGPVSGEGLDEVSSGYIGFWTFHMDYFDSLMEGARHGFGVEGMYLGMIKFLIKNGFFFEAKDLFECWTSNNDGKESLDIQMAGGFVYSNLFQFDKAIAWYGKAVETFEDSLAIANLGKLYLINGDREKAVKYLQKSINMEPNYFLDKIVSIINEEGWRPQTLSLCMIARDEESTIRTALESMKKIADEIIIVDTGSLDKTRDIAKEYGGKIIETKWRDDFSIAKNLALQEAHCDYIFFLDADEFIDTRDRLEFAVIKKVLPPDHNLAFKARIESDKPTEKLSVTLQDEILKQDSKNYQVRLFPRKKAIQFEGTAFENVDKSLRRAGIQLGELTVKITHKREKCEHRDRRKICAVAKSFSSLDDPVRRLEGGLFFLKLGDFDKAYPWLEKADAMDPRLLSKIAVLYIKRNKQDKAKALVKGGLKHFPDSLDLNLALAQIYYKEEKYNRVIDLLRNRIDDIKKDLGPESAAEASYYCGISLLEINLLAEGAEFISYASEEDPLDTKYKIGGLYVFSRADQWENTLEFASQLMSEENINIEHEIKDFSDVGLVFIKLSRHFAVLGRSEEAGTCQKILEHIIRTRISNKEEVDKMTRMLGGLSMENR